MTDSNKGLRILIVEDNPGDQYLITELLTASVIKIQLLKTAETLAKAIDLLHKEIFDIILLDLFLPESSGIETFQTLKKFTGKIPVIILSGLTDMNLAVEAISLGAQDYLLKEDLDKKMLGKSVYYSIERKFSLETLRESEAKYRSMIERNPAGVYQTTPEGNILICNDAFANMLGYGSHTELLQKKASDFYFLSNDRPDIITHLLENGEMTNKEVKLVHKNGTPVYIIESCTLIKDSVTGEQIIEGVILDITERKKAENAMRESEEKYRILIEQAPDGIFISGPDTFIIDANNSGCSLLGYAKEELQKMKFTELISPETLRTNPVKFDELRSGNTVLNERKLIRKDGSEISVEISARLLSDGRYQSFIRDITERKKAEDALRQSNERNDIVAKATSDVIWDWDLVSGKVFRSKEGLKKVYGYDDNAPIEMVTDWNRQVHPDDREMIEKLIEKIHQSPDQTTFSAEYRFLGKNGKYANVFDRRYIIRDEHGKPVRMIGAAQNITERKKIEESILKSEEQYRDLVDNITDLICTHDLNGRVLSANRAAEKLIGRKFDSQENLNIKDILTADTKHYFNQYIDEIQKKGHVHGLMKVQTLAGEIRIWEYSNSLKTTGVKTPVVRGYARDITERKKAEDALRESEETFRRVFNESADSILLLDDTGFTDCNQSAVSIFGYSSKQDVLNKKPWEISPERQPDGRLSTEKAEAMIAKALQQGYNRFEWVHTKSDGTEFSVEVMLTSIILKGKQSYYALLRDITERKKAEEELRQSNERFKMIAQSTNDAIWEWNFETNTIWGNEIYQNLYGCTMADPVRDHELWKQRIHPDDREKIINDLELALASDKNVSIAEYRFLTENGGVINIYDRAYIVRNEAGKPVRIMGAIQDITERKKAEERIRINETRLTKAQQIGKLGYWQQELNSNMIWGSEEAKKIYGFPAIAGELASETIAACIPDFVKVRQAAIDLIKHDKKYDIEFQLNPADGSPVRYVSAVAEIEKDEQGIPVRFMGVLKDITEYKESKKDLEESEYLLRESQSIARLGSYTWDISTGLWSSSKILDDIFGIDENFTRSFKGWADLIHPDWKEVMSKYVSEEVLGKHGRFDKEYKITRNDNCEECWVHGIGELVYDNNKQPIKLIGTISDITKRKKAELSLIESEEKYRSLIEQASDFIMITDQQGNFIDANSNFCKTFGYTKKELFQLNINAVLDSVQLKSQPLRFDLLVKGETVLRERRMINRSGAIIDVEANVKMLPDGRILAIARDIRDRKKTAEVILKSNARFQMLSKATSDIVWDWDLIDESLWWNDNYYSLLGIKKEKEITEINDWYKRIHPEDLKRIKEKIKKAIDSSATSWNDEYRFAKADGTYLNFLDRGYVMRDKDGKAYRMIGSMVDTTPVYTAQKEVAESENRLRTIYETEPECIKILGPEGGLLDMNPAGLAMIEADNLEMVKGKPVLGIIVPQYREAFEKLTRDVFKGKSGILEFEIIGLKGTHRWLETHAVPMRNASGTIIALLGVTRNITERKKAEQGLKESEVKYRTLIEQAVDAIALYDASGKILDVNTGSVNLLGYSKEELMKMVLSDILTKEELKTKPIRYDVLQKGESTIKQRNMRRKNGSVVQTEVRSQQLPDGRFLSVIRDLTERTKAQEQLEREKELSDSIINSLPGVFYLQDYTSKYLRWNKKFETVTGYNAGEISKLNPLDFFAGDEKKAIINKIGEVLAKGSSDIETVIITKSGKRIPYYLTGQLIQYEGKPCFIGVGVDITDRKKAEQELQESYKAIRQLTKHLQNIREKERAHMAREIHDELGQQLTVLKMDISWLNKRIGPTAADPVKQKMKELLEMLDGTVKTVRRISSELRPSLLDDLGLVAAMEWQMAEFEKHSGIKISFTEPGVEVSLPDDKKIGLFRIFQESLTNVARHAEAKKIKVDLMCNNNNFVLQIADNGKGFDKLKITGKRTLGILGMKERTAMIGGTYEITGTPGKGTVVLVTVPLEVKIDEPK